MLEKYGLTTGVMPQCSWSYMQTLPQGDAQRIPASGCAGTDYELVKEVRQFRINAGIDIGDVEFDVAEYIKQHSPINNRFPKRTYEPQADEAKLRGHRPYIERIREWLQFISAKRPRLVIEDEADARVEHCFKCPHNVPWKTGCLPCVEAVEARGINVRQRPRYKHDKQVGACRLHDIHISTAVFVDREFLPETHQNAPDFCWLRNIV